MVLLTKEEEEMKKMIRRLERYIKKKKLTVNVDKSKIMRFRKGRGRRKEGEWRWKGERIEEVKKFKYLGYTFQRNGQQGNTSER